MSSDLVNFIVYLEFFVNLRNDDTLLFYFIPLPASIEFSLLKGFMGELI